VAEAPDVIAGWGAIDAAKGALAVSQVHEAARLGMKGIAVHPAAQGMGPGDRLSSPVWEAAAEYGLVCLVHTGTTRLGYATAGGAGVKLSAGNPLHVDSVAAKLPHLRLLLAHTGPLWAEEAIAVASHKANVYLCPTGAAPQSWPGLADAAATTLRDRIVFGSGYPLGDPDALVEQWRQSDMAETTLQQVLVDNSVALFDW
jgi:predicted TIM-barrel fold metal-dependent hydrolase